MSTVADLSEEEKGKLSDEELMSRFYACDGTAHDELVSRWWRRIYQYFLDNGCSPEDAADLTQEVFNSVFRTKTRGEGRFDPSRRFPPWVYRLAGNRLIAHRRRPQRERTGRQDLDDAPDRRHGDSPEQRRLEVDLEDCRGRLTDEERRLLALLEGGLSQTEAAEELGVSGATVSRRYARVLEKLRECMEEKGYS